MALTGLQSRTPAPTCQVVVACGALHGVELHPAASESIDPPPTRSSSSVLFLLLEGLENRVFHAERAALFSESREWLPAAAASP